MKSAIHIFGTAIVVALLCNLGCAKKQPILWRSVKNPEVTAQLKNFVAEKEAQADASTNESPPGLAPFFAAAKKGDWPALNRAFADFRKRAGQYDGVAKPDERLRGTKWQDIIEIWGAFDAFGEGDAKYSAAYGNNIVASIPPGSIYFGGTDSGRFVVTAMQKSHVNGDPFFGLTQNALADSTYLDYVRGMYANKIYIPSSEDSARCFEEYKADFNHRAALGQLQPGEGGLSRDSRVAVSGQVSVMKVNGLLCKVIFDKNPDREFYIEESYPLDWMYPHLEPHGLIMKINRQPLSELPEDVVAQDRDYWTKYVTPMIGDWLHDDTTVGDVAAFAEKTFEKQDFTGFTGDPRFIQNAYAHRMYSKLRSSIAGVYAWRMTHATTPDEKTRMASAADFAFRQAWALCPDSPEAVFRYVNLLVQQNRFADAATVAETAAQMPAMEGRDGAQVRALVEQLKKLQKQK